MSKILQFDGPYQDFQEENLGDLDGMRGCFVEPGTGDGTVQLLTAVGNEIGVIYEKPDARDKTVSVRMLGGGGSVVVKAGGVIAKGARMKPAVGGKAVAAPNGESVGRKLTHGNSADGDLVEMLDFPGYVAP